MVLPSDETPQPNVYSIPARKWLLMAVAFSIIGSILITVCLAVLDQIRSGTADPSNHSYYVHEWFGLLYYFGFYSLIINLLGAVFLIALFAIWKRLRR